MTGTEPGVSCETVVVGRPIDAFEPLPPSASLYRPDTVCDGWSTAAATVRAASVRGYRHRFEGRPREDDFALAVHEATGTVVFAVADGVSAAWQPHVGAALACRTSVDDVLAQLNAGAEEIDWRRTCGAAAWQLVMRITGGAEPGPTSRQEAERQLATTLVCGVVRPVSDGSLALALTRIGDSGAWILRDGRYSPLFEDPEVAADEPESCAVTPLPRVPAELVPVSVLVPPDAALLIGTDGFGDALGDGSGSVGDLFARLLRNPPAPVVLGHVLDFSRENFDDDRTLVAVWPRLAGEVHR
ncbi:protein phosphatase 2C domain-containing protein [Streptomyces sp. NPDC001480]|uniref:protein phosphatase 2C domain-containing protein n=1 Tax=Streptomyces sp. NPDC001480 TaxID=3364577 RepID=UPI0036869F3D